MSCIYFLHGSELQGDHCCMWKKTAVCSIKTFITASLCHFFVKVLQWVTPPITEGNKILTSVNSTLIIRQVLITIGFYFWSTCKSHIADEALILLQAIFSFQSRLYSSAGTRGTDNSVCKVNECRTEIRISNKHSVCVLALTCRVSCKIL